MAQQKTMDWDDLLLKSEQLVQACRLSLLCLAIHPSSSILSAFFLSDP